MNRDYFTHPLQSDRLSDGYGNTKIKPERYGAPFYPGIFGHALIILFVVCGLVVGVMAVMP